MDEFRKLVEIMARLRANGGCEWDRAQTHETLRQYLVEETHEVIDAIRQGAPKPDITSSRMSMMPCLVHR